MALYIDHLERERTASAFDRYVDDDLLTLENRLDTYATALNGAAGLFAGSNSVTALDWQRYVGSLNLKTEHPGILGVGFAAVMPGDTGSTATEQGSEAGNLSPSGQADDLSKEKFVVQFIEPLAENAAALGLDLGFEANRRAALEASRQTGRIGLTAPIELVQASEKKPGFLLLRPVYSSDSSSIFVDSDEDSLLGWTYMAFLGDATFHSLHSQKDQAAVISAVDAAGSPDAAAFYVSDEPGDPQYGTYRELEVFGRKWVLLWTSTPQFERSSISVTKWIIFALGLVLTSLLSLTLRFFAKTEDRIKTDVARKTQELRAKTEEAQSVLDNAVFSIFVLDENDRIVSANQAAGNLFGHDAVARGNSIHAILKRTGNPSQRGKKAQPASCRKLPELRLMVEENSWKTAGGRDRRTLLVKDVSEVEAGARKLQESEARWDMALAGAQIGVFDIDLKTQKSIVSDTWRSLMQVPPDTSNDAAQKIFMSRIHPDDRCSLEKADRECIEGRTSRSIAEYRVKFPNGVMRWMKSDAVVVDRDSQGNALRLLGAQTDITALREAEESLRESQKRFELVLTQAPVGMALFDAKGAFLGMNDALCRMTGYDELEMRQQLRFSNLISGTDFVSIKEKVYELMKAKQTSYHGEYQIIPKSGPAFWGLLSVAWTSDPRANEDVFIVQINDISEKKNIEKIKSEFVATVSHELRTPLTSIKGAIGLLRGPLQKDMPSGAERLLEIAAANTDRLSALVNDILDLEKISSGEVEFHVAPHCLAEVLKQCAEQMLPFARQHRSNFVLDLPQAEVMALIDPTRTEQLIANLLSNACKYSDPETAIHIRLEVLEDQALVCVLNSGPAIPDEFKARIFQPFSQADASDTRTIGGTGLGLNISQQIVERMGGKIGFQSKKGAPTAFWFVVPLAECQKIHPIADGHADLFGPAINVLHLEDDRDFLEIVSRGLGEKANVTSALTLSEARKALKRSKFHVIVVDWELPDGHASDLLHDIQELQPSAKVIALSARETGIRDLRVDLELIKTRSDLEEIVSKVVQVCRVAS